MLRDRDSGFEELATAEDADALCRLLIASPYGWSRSTRHLEAVEILANVGPASERSLSFVALLLSTCRRWDRVTARLIAAIEDSGHLSEADLDDLADSFLTPGLAIAYSVAWISPQWLEIDVRDGTSRTVTVEDDALEHHRPAIQPPLRRWAAQRAARANPSQLDDLLLRAGDFEPRHRDALIHGLLDAADAINEAQRRLLIAPGLATAQAGARKAALDLLCELDGSEPALHRAQIDSNASVRDWHPQQPELIQSLFPT